MKKTYLRAGIAALGLFTATNLSFAQSAGAGGGAGSVGGSAGSAATGSTASGAGATTTTAAGAGAGRATPGGTLNTVGAAGINTPAGRQPIGAASTVQANPPTAAGAVNNGGILGTTPGTTPSATLPGGSASSATTAAGVPFNTLPSNVRSTLQGFSANGSLGTVSAVQGQPGTFRASIVQNGVPMELTIAPNGQILSRTPVTGSPAVAPNSAISAAQAGIPLTSLPPALASSIQSQLRGAQVQSISRDDLANGSVFRVTTLQNGVPTEMRFAANGTLLGTTPLNGTATSTFLPAGTVVPGGALVMDELPQNIQDTVRNQLGNLEASRIMQQRGTNGINYAISYQQDGRPMMMVVAPDGRVLSNGPANVGVAAATSRGNASGNTEATRSTSIKLDDLPSNVSNALKQKAPYAEVRTITREQRVGGDVYVIAVRDDDRAGEIVIDANGKIIRDDRRELSTLTPAAPTVPPEKPEGMPYDKLPVAIQNAVKAYATASDIRSITLGLDRDGKTIYDVVYYHDGDRNRMIVDKSGRLVRIEENVSPAFELHSNKAPVIAIADLPQQVRDTIRRQTDKVMVKEIETKEVGGQQVYAVSYTGTNGTPTELLVNSTGEVVLPEGDQQSDQPQAPIRADVDKEEPSPVRIVDGTQSDKDRQAAGTSAQAQQESATSAAEIITPIPVAEVKLSDTPQPVQNTVKKLAAGASIDRVTPKLGTSGVTYEVSFMQDGKPRTVIVDRKGVIQNKQPSIP